ncbi:hypothetical protein MmiEs2_02260 [Methanimicrococcus stummii]|uniref:4Fe-4S domain-containing protein n=1 Tax=Methanimicrococcus stummii TaxID=3028294 RepID=A0AA96V8X8_9EURY|nr:(Fe-S)-binding protein [Methanimicrococcus sp. Es2]WNY28046.1 hypothetical protein MmiEs2_02260 [Methanimicrococcus sp. Es2]
MSESKQWTPPGKNCGVCGFQTCADFSAAVARKSKAVSDCIFYSGKSSSSKESPFPIISDSCYSGTDVTGMPYDFVIHAFPNEPSARKIILPFRPDLTERMDIRADDLVLGRPAGAGCPVQHVLKVREADPVTGVIIGYVVSPAEARENSEIKDVKMYHMIGFEGRAQVISNPPEFGKRYSFLPGFCMMHRAHSGLVNLVLNKPSGIHVRVEGVIVL